MEIKKVGVLGCGLMGSGIAQVAAASGREVVVREVSQELIDRGISGIDRSLSKFVEKGKLTAEDRNATMGRLSGSTSDDALADCDLVIEAIVENVDVKRQTYQALDAVCK